jgi:NhaP-type Na+/H+ or K+/H+ antiporter
MALTFPRLARTWLQRWLQLLRGMRGRGAAALLLLPPLSL